jgi:hypothetical protein
MASSSSSLTEATLSPPGSPLPDSPGTISAANATSDNIAFADPSPAQTTIQSFIHPAPPTATAAPLDKYIEPGQQAAKITAGDKILIGLRHSVSLFSMAGWVGSAEYGQLLNGSPNYGTNGKAFAQRLGAAAARNGSQAIFADSVMAPILHEDPRYYIMGPGHSILKRTVYAITRPLITRTDSGRSTVNFSLLTGNLAGSALTQAYYPPVNRGFSQTMQTFGNSLGGSAIGFAVSEFTGDILKAIHLTKSQ